MGKSSIYMMFEICLVVASYILLFIGLIKPSDFFLLQIIGILTSVGGLALTILITIGAEGESDVDDITFVNALLYPLLVADILAIGSWLDALPVTQSIFLDFGIIMGLFIIFLYIWYLLREKVKGGISFLEVDVVDIDFHGTGDADKYPKFYLVTIILGALYGALFAIFKIIYAILAPIGTDFAFNYTSYVLIIVVLVSSLDLAFGARVLKGVRKKKVAKLSAKPAVKPKES